MDNAVGLVEAYLRVNGYFTVSEFPIVEDLKEGHYRTVTDLDILAFRFPGAGRLVVPTHEGEPGRCFVSDPLLAAPAQVPDMLIGEVKEGKARLNRAARDPMVIQTALERFGCCGKLTPDSGVVQQLLREGQAETNCGHNVRLVLFGSSLDSSNPEEVQIIPLAHVKNFLQEYIRRHWEVLRHMQLKDPIFGLLTTLEKADRGGFPNKYYALGR